MHNPLTLFHIVDVLRSPENKKQKQSTPILKTVALLSLAVSYINEASIRRPPRADSLDVSPFPFPPRFSSPSPRKLDSDLEREKEVREWKRRIRDLDFPGLIGSSEIFWCLNHFPSLSVERGNTCLREQLG
ncbi:hypothetical protein Cni_G11127 [Canna indica]|uniref:Uncharacterized protein n=1 Tax=Canna indica TaxID=4628 RepID=A0AAQ3K818_9LILI|nr:hypothetical protein Cni_G11127 [Canna indica]